MGYEVNCAVPMVETEDSDSLNHGIPQQLIDGGNHIDNIANIGRDNRQRRYNAETRGTALPRDSCIHWLPSLVLLDQH
jgi:hypothetical protein